MKGSWVLLAVGFALPGIRAPAIAGDLERFQMLLESPPGSEEPASRELLDLARRTSVRKWLLQRVRDALKGPEWDGSRVELPFTILAKTDPGREETQILTQEAARLKDFGLSRLSQILLENAPLALDVEPLIDLLATRAAVDLHDPELSNCIWLLAHRAPVERVKKALAKAWSAAPPIDQRTTDPHRSFGELTFVLPDGSAPVELLWVRDVGAWNPSQLVVWPDGKARCTHWLRDNESLWEPDLQVNLPGYKESQRTRAAFAKGKVSQFEVRLGERRARARGKISPAPRYPLFARVHSKLPVGDALDSYRLQRGELSIPVRPDGSFEAPFNSGGKVLLILDIDGNVQHSQPIAFPEGGGDFDVGEVKLAAARGLVEVPMYVEWPSGISRGDFFQGDVSWKSESPDVPEGKTHFYGSASSRIARPFVGLARNLPPGKYTVKVRFQRETNHGEVSEVMTSFNVTGPKDSFVIQPAKGKASPAPTADAPTGAGIPVAHGTTFLLKAGPGGQLYLMTLGSDIVRVQVREGGKFKPERILFAPPDKPRKAFNEDSPDGWTSHIDFYPDKDGSLHAFRTAFETKDHAKIYYARVPKDGAKPPRWAQIADELSPNDDDSPPMVLQKKNGALEVLSQVVRIRMQDENTGDIESLRLYRGSIQGGQLKSLPPVPVGEDKLPGLSPLKLVGTPENDPQLLGSRNQGKLFWMGLKRPGERPAGDAPASSRFQDSAVATTPQGDVYLALPLDAGKGRSSIWVARGKPGRAFEEIGTLEGSFPSQQTSLSVTPKGDVYLVASVRGANKEDGQVGLWKLSGPFPPPPLLTPWLDRSAEPPQAVFLDPSMAEVAWSRNNSEIYVDTFVLQGK